MSKIDFVNKFSKLPLLSYFSSIDINTAFTGEPRRDTLLPKVYMTIQVDGVEIIRTIIQRRALGGNEKWVDQLKDPIFWTGRVG